MTCTVKPASRSQPTIIINKEIASNLGIKNHDSHLVCYGSRKKQVMVEIDPGLEKNIVNVDEQLINYLLIDTKVDYEILNYKDQLIIGPVIGLLFGRTEKNLIKQLKNFLPYTFLYGYINGVIVVFAEDQIDFAKQQISGYVYDPNLDDTSEIELWRKAVLPIPGAIFRRVNLRAGTFKKLQSVTGNRLFNTYYFDKWDFWNIIKPFKNIVNHLPETTDQLEKTSLDHFISKYQGAYLKPRDGSEGKGIYYIEEKQGTYKIQKNYHNDVLFLTPAEIEQFFKEHPRYLLQQPIALKRYQGRKIDYRVIIQKDGNGMWQCTGIIGRFGMTDAITSNMRSHGYAKEGFLGLQLQFNYDAKSAYQKYEEMVECAVEIAKALDKVCGPYADLGVDIGIDRQQKVWIIEVNKRPEHRLPLMIDDVKMYYEVKSNTVLYAKKLALLPSSL